MGLPESIPDEHAVRVVVPILASFATETVTIREFTLNYYNEHMEELEAMSLAEFKNNFKVTEDMLKALIRTGESVDVAFNAEQFEVSKPLIINRVKSFIARSVWDNEGWYRIANEYNEIYQEALTQFDEAEHLASAIDLRE